MQKLIPTLLIYAALFFVLSTVIKRFFNEVPLSVALQNSVFPTIVYTLLMGVWLIYKAKKQNRL